MRKIIFNLSYTVELRSQHHEPKFFLEPALLQVNFNTKNTKGPAPTNKDKGHTWKTQHEKNDDDVISSVLDNILQKAWKQILGSVY